MKMGGRKPRKRKKASEKEDGTDSGDSESSPSDDQKEDGEMNLDKYTTPYRVTDYTRRYPEDTSNGFLKLSLKKTREQDTKKPSRSSDLIIIDESFDCLTSEFAETMAQKIYSPIVIDDSTDASTDSDLPEIKLPDPEPAKAGNMAQKIYSPIVIDDSTDASTDSDLPEIKLPDPEPAKAGNMAQKIYSPIVIDDSTDASTDSDLPEIKLPDPEPAKAGNMAQKIYSPIVIDDSTDASTDSDLPEIKLPDPEPAKAGNMAQKIYSPIVIDDSTDASTDSDLPEIKLPDPEPAKAGNVSFNGSQRDTSVCEVKDPRPSIGGCWSPAQGIICATPRDQTIPSTPKDIVNESSEQCTIKKIQQSQKKLLSELYGEIWKSIPTLFKNGARKDSNNISNCTKKLDFLDDSDTEINIRKLERHNKELYLTGLDAKKKVRVNDCLTEKKSKKKLYTEIVPSMPQPARIVKRDANSTTKKLKNKSVTELVYIMKDKYDVDSLTEQVEKVCVTPDNNKHDKLDNKIIDSVKRLSFMGSLTDNVPSWRMHPEAYEYLDNFKGTKEKLARRLFKEFNKNVFQDGLDADMIVQWDTKLRTTAGLTTNRAIKKADGTRLRSSSIKLSLKVVDGPQRLRDTLIHELCHAATWIIDQELKAGHGPLWKKWAHRAVQVYPELGEISRCHDMEIHFKFTYKCTKCGYTINRQSKSLDIESKCCGYCRGKFVIFRNKKNKDGVVVSTPARQREASDFALYVKQNYGTLKDGKKTHAQVMKLLGEQFSAKKKIAIDS